MARPDLNDSDPDGRLESGALAGAEAAYSDFDSSIDKVAAVGIGGSIAGKVLAKAGLCAVIAKFAKFIVVGVVAAIVGLRRASSGGGRQPAAAAVTADRTRRRSEVTLDRGGCARRVHCDM